MSCNKCGAELPESGVCSCCDNEEHDGSSSAFARIQPKQVRVELSEAEREILQRQRAEYESGAVVREASEHLRDLNGGGLGAKQVFILLLLICAVLLVLTLAFSFTAF